MVEESKKVEEGEGIPGQKCMIHNLFKRLPNGAKVEVCKIYIYLEDEEVVGIGIGEKLNIGHILSGIHIDEAEGGGGYHEMEDWVV